MKCDKKTKQNKTKNLNVGTESIFAICLLRYTFRFNTLHHFFQKPNQIMIPSNLTFIEENIVKLDVVPYNGYATFKVTTSQDK